MGCTTSAAKKKKEEAKAQVQAVLDPDEVIDCFDDTDDLDVGFKYIVEKEVELIKDIRMTNGFFNLIETQINNEVVYPERLQKMNQLFNRIFGNLRNEQKLFFKNNQNIDFSNVELDTFTEAEVYHPQLSKNKHEYIKLIFKQIKNFVQNVKLPRKLHYENCRAFLLAKFVKIKKAPPDDNDEKIDVRYTAVFRELLTYMMEDPRNITACTHLLFCAKNLERIGDHVTNIAENAYYVVTGEQLPVSRPKHDETTAAIVGA